MNTRKKTPFHRQSLVLDGASQYYATDHGLRLKDGLFPFTASRLGDLLQSLLECRLEFRRRASHLLAQRGHGAAVAGIVSVPRPQAPVAACRSFFEPITRNP